MTSTNEKPMRWGFLSTAQIGRKNWKAIRNSGNGVIVAVASRKVDKARAFISDCQADASFAEVPRAVGSYEELLAAQDIDAVYIPLPTGMRKEWVIRAADTGKHIVCEKPCATNEADLRAMLEACRANQVQFLDGVMFMHSGRLDSVRQFLNDGISIGPLKRITSAFSFCAPPEFFAGNIRANSVLEPHGCLGDLGWYCIRFALWTMNWQLPLRVTGRILADARDQNSSAGVPTEFSGELLFENGISSAFYCSFLTHNEQWAQINGTKGSVRVPDFVAPFFGDEVHFEINNSVLNTIGCDFNMEARRHRVSVPEYSNSHASSQETNLFRNFTAQVRTGKLNDLWPEMALKTQQVMEACLTSARENGREVAVA